MNSRNPNDKCFVIWLPSWVFTVLIIILCCTQINCSNVDEPKSWKMNSHNWNYWLFSFCWQKLHRSGSEKVGLNWSKRPAKARIRKWEICLNMIWWPLPSILWHFIGIVIHYLIKSLVRLHLVPKVLQEFHIRSCLGGTENNRSSLRAICSLSLEKFDMTWNKLKK